MYCNGIYHLFYQYSPKGVVWGNIVWAHSISKDHINWVALDSTIYSSKPFNINGCWSGSATILLGNKSVILYTRLDPQNKQVESYAVPANLSDQYLREWFKPNDNPLMVSTPNMNTSAFRDPTMGWIGRDEHWRMVVGSRMKHQGMAYLYQTRDFMNWVKAKHPLHSTPKIGMSEWPNFYPIAGAGSTGWTHWCWENT
ncbi:beta-fructofuranosidase, insoluble isoenzyme 1-like [Malania oleifera]|uniref:beta-fructofuranosidase, insoluble isoenzyme 1-like n=1 Tax=Malania oleifera TaxID=397392 RepID=UPI0025AE75B9|nr:beta-fructofuranosidase, insoluble isoenzyme 1-like [Malania oleifera]